MTSKQFKLFWKKQNTIFWELNSEKIDSSGIGKETFTFLSSYGVPHNIAPCLTFDEDCFYDFKTPGQYFGIDEPTLDHYFVIGTEGNGDPICIDISSNDQIVSLNHDNDWIPLYMNSNIAKCMFCLVVYCQFISEINSVAPPKGGLSNFLEGLAPKETLSKLRANLISIDSDALKEGSMWAAELSAFNI